MKRLLRVALLLAIGVATAGATWLQFQSQPADGTAGMTVTGLLRVPDGAGPFPAAVLLPDCDGISPHERTWGRRFQDAGYVTYLIDSLFTRDLDTGCGIDVPVMDDLLGALAKLADLSEVDPTQIVVVGWQGGADLALDWAGEPGPGVAVAFYPACAAAPGLARPTLLVLPELAAGAAACEAYVRREHQAGAVAVQRIAPYGVGAGFDCQTCGAGYLGGSGGWNETADSLVKDSLFGEIERLLTSP